MTKPRSKGSPRPGRSRFPVPVLMSRTDDTAIIRHGCANVGVSLEAEQVAACVRL